MDWQESVKRTFEIFKPSGVIEVRNISENRVTSGYFEDRQRVTQIMTDCAKGTWYFVLNDIAAGCASRQQHEQIMVVSKAIKTTSDNDITRIRWILIDADPQRAAGISSTDSEKKAALDVVRKVFAYLRNVGFSDPVMCDSGNGYHLLYNVDMACGSADLTKRFLKALDMLFSTDEVSIDTSVYNPARITKLYGCMATKGADTPDRPHRRSSIQWVPTEVKPTSASLIERVASIVPVDAARPAVSAPGQAFDIDAFVSRNGLQVHSDSTSGSIRKIVLEECPFDHSHKAPDSAIFVMPSGAIAFKCFHNGCTDKGWKDLREMYEGKKAFAGDFRQVGNYPVPTARPCEPQESEHFKRLQDIETLDRSKIVTIKTGINGIDGRMLGMNKGELSIWSGGSGSGKSTVLSQLILQVASQGYSCALFSGELTNNRAKNWLVLQAAGRQYNELSQNGITYYTPKIIMDKIDAWAADKIWIYNNDYGTEAMSVLSDFERHMKEHRTDVVVIDNLMSMDVSKITGDKYDKQTMIVLALSAMAKKYNVHVHFVCHPRKPNGFLRKADISGTADITNAADNVFMVHRINQDFVANGTAFFGEKKIKELAAYTNAIEIMKNRDLGVSDEFVGLYYEPESKRFLNTEHENVCYGWQDNLTDGCTLVDEDLPWDLQKNS